jgi:hypothetical protein
LAARRSEKQKSAIKFYTKPCSNSSPLVPVEGYATMPTLSCLISWVEFGGLGILHALLDFIVDSLLLCFSHVFCPLISQLGFWSAIFMAFDFKGMRLAAHST